MSTYPKTYDLIHDDSLFSLYNGRCELQDIMLEMDRILRPEGAVIIRDDVLVKVKNIANGLEWDSSIVDHENGPLEREREASICCEEVLDCSCFYTFPQASQD
jgi:hypothetical protein